jgi:clan AA aspartic protease (TIGR02281 family)
MGSPEAMLRIGMLFANGQGVVKDSTEAMRWCSRAAELGNGLAQYNLGLGYLNGVGVQRDAKRALFWMTLASDRLTDAKAKDTLRKYITAAEGLLDEDSRRAALSEVESWRPGSIPVAIPSELQVWVGKYPTDRVQGRTFLERPEIQLLINATLGSDAVSKMKDMLVVDTIKQDKNWIIAHGCQPHMCSDGQWLVAINLSSLETRACLAQESSATVRFGATGTKYVDQPRGSDHPCPAPEEALTKFDQIFSSPFQNSATRMEVALKRDGDLFVVPIEINGAITLGFTVDSGASDVSVPVDVFSTLVRAGTIRESDITGEQTYILADGSKSRSLTFIIRSLKIGDKVIENVKASVAPAQGLLLLGQSFLGRFKSWALDNTKHELLLQPQ